MPGHGGTRGDGEITSCSWWWRTMQSSLRTGEGRWGHVTCCRGLESGCWLELETKVHPKAKVRNHREGLLLVLLVPDGLWVGIPISPLLIMG